MNTVQINEQMKSLDCFIGTFPINRLPNVRYHSRPLGVIINLDPSYLPGSHWVAIFIDMNNIAWYLDSFGRPTFDSLIEKFLLRNNVELLFHNNKKFQGKLSQVCGPYCIYFIKMMCSSFEPDEFLKMFSRNKSNNDRFVVRILQ